MHIQHTGPHPYQRSLSPWLSREGKGDSWDSRTFVSATSYFRALPAAAASSAKPASPKMQKGSAINPISIPLLGHCPQGHCPRGLATEQLLCLCRATQRRPGSLLGGTAMHRPHLAHRLCQLSSLIQHEASLGFTASKIFFIGKTGAQLAAAGLHVMPSGTRLTNQWLYELFPALGSTALQTTRCTLPSVWRWEPCLLHWELVDTNTIHVLEINQHLISYNYVKSSLNSILQISTDMTQFWWGCTYVQGWPEGTSDFLLFISRKHKRSKNEPGLRVPRACACFSSPECGNSLL